MSANYPINSTNLASCTEGPPVFCDGYAQGYPHGIEAALGRELGAKAADHDWTSLKGSNSNTLEIVPPCPSGHQLIGEMDLKVAMKMIGILCLILTNLT
jgi:hypothetical protein